MKFFDVFRLFCFLPRLKLLGWGTNVENTNAKNTNIKNNNSKIIMLKIFGQKNSKNEDSIVK